MYCRRTDIVEVARWDGWTRPGWLLDAIDAGQVVPISATQATVQGQHCGAGQWIVKRGDKLKVYGDAYFKKHYTPIEYRAVP